MVQSILDINSWRKNLGFFPQTLFQKQFQYEKYILLNGKGGNFCVDYSDEEPDKCRSYAWSANVSHYITINGDKLKLYRWDKESPTDELSVESIINRLEPFNDYIAKQQIKSTNDSINLSLGLYRQIRSALRDKKGENSLRAFLYALAVSEDNVSNLKNLNKDKWGLSASSLTIASQVKDSTWQQIIDTLSNGVFYLKKIKPKVELLLRHASGKIFQEAHLESIFSSQLSFPEFGLNQPMGLIKSLSSVSSHYTPTSIVRSIVEEILRGFDLKDKKELIIFDPAVGSGEFLKEALRQLTLIGYSGKIKLIGYDISSAAIDLANFSLHFEKQAAKSPSRVEIKIELKDALTEGNLWNIQPDIILMNPPFVSWENMTEKEKEKVSDIIHGHYSGRPNEAGAFLWKAVNSLNMGGRLGCIVPSSILEANSFLKLRADLTQNMHIDFLAKLGSQTIFENAIAASSILISTNSPSINPTQLMWSDNTEDGYAAGLRKLRIATSILPPNEPFVLPGINFNFYSIKQLNNKNWTPIDLNSYQLINVRLNKMSKVSDLFDIKQGVRTGLNKAFLVSKKFMEGLPRTEQKYFRPAITNDSIQLGCLNDNYYIFYPEGQNVIKNEKELKSLVQTFYDTHFSQYKEKLSKRARKSIDDYWKLSEHRNWQLKFNPKIVSTEFGLSGSFAFDHKGIFVAERSHAWLPKDSKNWENIGYAYVSILCMNIINELLKGVSKQISSGSYYLSSQFLNDMPLPNLFDNSIDIAVKNELIRIGKLISMGQSDNRSRLQELTNKVFNG